LENGKGFQYSLQVTQLVIDFHILIQFTGFIRRQFQVVFFGDINDRLSADRAFKVAMDFGFWEVIIFGIEVFHEKPF
jgi:hypothetical protein